jgi:hypothetical protein
MNKYINIHEELRDTIHKSLELAISIKKSNAEITGYPIKPGDKKKIVALKRELINFREMIHKYKGNKQSSRQKSITPTPHFKHPNATSKCGASEIARAAGKQKLSKSIYEMNQRLLLTKAGKSGSPDLTSRDASVPPILKNLRETLYNTERSNSVFPSRMSVSTPINQLLEYEHIQALPHVSILNGKTSPPVQLPTFLQFCRESNINLSKKAVKEKLFDSLANAESKLKRFYNELDGLEIFVENNPGVKWDHDRKFLLKLKNNPHQRSNLIRSYNEKKHPEKKVDIRHYRARSTIAPGHDSPIKSKRSSRNSLHETVKASSSPMTLQLPVLEEREHGSKSTSKDPNIANIEEIFDTVDHMEGDIIGLDPKIVLDRCTRRFREVRNKQEVKLINILEKLDQERPLTIKEKYELISKDTEKYRDPAHSIKMFDHYKRKIEVNRLKRLDINKEQAKLYSELLNVIKDQAKEPTELQLNLLVILKVLIEGGWVIGKREFNIIVDGLSNEDGLSPEIKPMIKRMQKRLNLIDLNISDESNN